MQVAHHYFENGIAYFTRRINKSISLSKYSTDKDCFFFLTDRFLLTACANGEVAPFVGHNAYVESSGQATKARTNISW